MITLPSYYLPPISWFAALKSGEPTAIEVCENFQKQTLRNRCRIDSPNGSLMLSIPIDKSNFSELGKCLIRDVRISHQLDWRHQHWFAFETSYYNSPFFEYLQDDFRPIYERDWKYLVDLNEALIMKCLELLEIDIRPTRTTDYQKLAFRRRIVSKRQRTPQPVGRHQILLSGLPPQTSVFAQPFRLRPAYEHGSGGSVVSDAVTTDFNKHGNYNKDTTPFGIRINITAAPQKYIETINYNIIISPVRDIFLRWLLFVYQELAMRQP